MTIKVLKFGGTSVGSPEALRRAAGIIREELPGGGVVVVSALGGTTDQLLAAASASASGDGPAARRALSALRHRHQAQAEALGLTAAVAEPWGLLFDRLEQMIAGVSLLQEASPRIRDQVLAVGETLSAHLAAALLDQQGLPARFADAREVLRTDGRHGAARPQPGALRAACGPWRDALGLGAVLVTQGFIGEGPDGATTTLGRGGSDTSATLFGEALDASEVQIWTDVDGILSADPSLVPGAAPIPAMSVAEATALTAFGAKVLHADSLAPVARARIPLVVANTHRPRASRTEIRHAGPARRPGEVTSVAYKEGLSLLRFPSAFRLEDLLGQALALQEAGALRFGLLANPEGALLALRPETPAAQALVAALAADGVEVQRGWAVVALVGEGLRQDPGAALRLLAPLDHEPIGGLLTGSSGVSVAFLVPEARLADLIPRLHARCLEAFQPPSTLPVPELP
ncbi:MAG TPA: aspartate kinase [Holophagaceae bacterium]|nr:aspartate kinase [Holophagaceae bacterium]